MTTKTGLLPGDPPCPKCFKKDRLRVHMEGDRRIGVCWRCMLSGELRKADVSDRQLDILRHALGVDATRKRKGAVSHRNRYVTGPTCDGFADVEALVEVELMRKGDLCNQANPSTGVGETYYFHATRAGYAAVGAAWEPEDEP